MNLDRGAAALVELPTRDHVVVVCVHLKCCGYADSREDLKRIEQARELAGQIQRLRNGDFGEKAKRAGIVVVGDYNLVGSRTPLDIRRGRDLATYRFNRLPMVRPTRGAALGRKSPFGQVDSIW